MPLRPEGRLVPTWLWPACPSRHLGAPRPVSGRGCGSHLPWDSGISIWTLALILISNTSFYPHVSNWTWSFPLVGLSVGFLADTLIQYLHFCREVRGISQSKQNPEGEGRGGRDSFLVGATPTASSSVEEVMGGGCRSRRASLHLSVVHSVHSHRFCFTQNCEQFPSCEQLGKLLKSEVREHQHWPHLSKKTTLRVLGCFPRFLLLCFVLFTVGTSAGCCDSKQLSFWWWKGDFIWEKIVDVCSCQKKKLENVYCEGHLGDSVSEASDS